jgi:antitoxin ParD1/3/4
MGMIKKSITVTDQQDAWIKAQLINGDYGNESEVLRDLIRRAQHKNAEIDAIRAALIEAEESGFSTSTRDEIKLAVQERLRKNGNL